MTTNTEVEGEGGGGGTLENGGDDYLDSSEGGAHGAQYLRQAYVSDEHGEMNLATSSRRSSSNRYPSMGGGEID